jgi:hypothetical protein
MAGKQTCNSGNKRLIDKDVKNLLRFLFYLLYLYFEAVVAGEGTEVLIRPVRAVLTKRGNFCPSIINQWQWGTLLWSEKKQSPNF